MTEDKNLVKNDQCLRLFSSRRQPPLLVLIFCFDFHFRKKIIKSYNLLQRHEKNKRIRVSNHIHFPQPLFAMLPKISIYDYCVTSYHGEKVFSLYQTSIKLSHNHRIQVTGGYSANDKIHLVKQDEIRGIYRI